MSRIGRNPITIPADVSIALTETKATITGPKGELEVALPAGFSFEQTDTEMQIKKADENRLTQAQYGLLRTLIANAVHGVAHGFERKLEMNGVGFRVEKTGKDLVFSLGFSHKVNFQAPDNIELTVEGNVITVSGIDKQKVGQTAAQIRALKKPEPYKGKG
ncbi:50S ribosomal protein L6, partial [Candidatus Saccharibacteria bacterium]|nr:50S ribosomal protein L6 [Candidatus Saccharibacteria bacterium]